nr:hypothetical protein [Pseudomonadota bacterium]
LLADIATEQSYTVGTAITPLTFTNTGLDVATAGCTVSTALPAGLTLAAFDDAGKMTCQITGNPSAIAAKSTYFIIATAIDNSADVASVTITVAPDPLASPRLPDEAVTATATTRTLLAAPVLVANTEGNADITDCKFVDTANSDAQVATLAGLSIAAATNGRACEITGTPTEAGVQSFTVRAMSATGQDDATVTFTVVPKPLGLVRQSSSATHHCAVSTDDELYCWGFNGNSELGLGDTTNRNIPNQVGTATNWAQISAGSSHTCAVNTNGELHCWGEGTNGRLGHGDTSNRNIPTQVGTAINWAQVSAGGTHTCAINTNGELHCWGLGNDGQLGQEASASLISNPLVTPTQVGTAINWAQISAGGAHTCAINTTGQLYCWGRSFNGQLGQGDTSVRYLPTQVGTAINWAQISAGTAYTCAINTTGELYCWGASSSGQLGLGFGAFD